MPERGTDEDNNCLLDELILRKLQNPLREYLQRSKGKFPEALEGRKNFLDKEGDDGGRGKSALLCLRSQFSAFELI